MGVSVKAVLLLVTALLLVEVPLSAQEANEDVKVSIGDASAPKGENVTVPLMIYNVSDLGSAKVNLTYDESVLSVTGASNSEFDFSRLADRGSGWVLLQADQKTKGLDGPVKMLNLTLKAVGSKGDQTPLNLTDVSLEDMDMNTIPCEVVNGTFNLTPGDCSSDKGCVWCGQKCVRKGSGLLCPTVLPPEDYECACVNSKCVAVKISDSDGDGWSDEKEYKLGTDPFNQTDSPKKQDLINKVVSLVEEYFSTNEPNKKSNIVQKIQYWVSTYFEKY